MKVTIIANGDFSQSEIDLSQSEMLIAVDGGGSRCLELGISPDIVIGDFDSLNDKDLSNLELMKVRLIRFSSDKDETDLELALNYAQEHNASEIYLYGILGGRWDMTISNLMLLASSRFAGIKFQVTDSKNKMFILRGGESLDINGQVGDIVSVIPLNGDCQGLTNNGLLWPLVKAVLPFGTPRGVSNQMLGERAKIELDKGIALVTLIHQ
jgi:thiamine pyrophosphokinase